MHNDSRIFPSIRTPPTFKQQRCKSLPAPLIRPTSSGSLASDSSNGDDIRSTNTGKTKWIFNNTSPSPPECISSTIERNDLAYILITQVQNELQRSIETLTYERHLFKNEIEEYRKRECLLKEEIKFVREDLERKRVEIERLSRINSTPIVVPSPIEFQPSQGFHHNQSPPGQRFLPAQSGIGQGFTNGFIGGYSGPCSSPLIGNINNGGGMRSRLVSMSPCPVGRSISLPRY